jgi:predicted ATPase
MAVPFLLGVKTVIERLPLERVFPYDLPFVPSLDRPFHKPVAFFVGENGTGKSTLLEAIAVLCRLPVSGGSRNEANGSHGPENDSLLSRVLRPSFRRQPRDGFFLRAEFAAHFASLLDERKFDPEFWGDPYSRYGGKSLHTRSHGEAFLAIFKIVCTRGSSCSTSRSRRSRRSGNWHCFPLFTPSSIRENVSSSLPLTLLS